MDTKRNVSRNVLKINALTMGNTSSQRPLAHLKQIKRHPMIQFLVRSGVKFVEYGLVKGYVRYSFITESPLKIMKNAFSFI